jgi:hypothetical protein
MEGLLHDAATSDEKLNKNYCREMAVMFNADSYVWVPGDEDITCLRRCWARSSGARRARSRC